MTQEAQKESDVQIDTLFHAVGRATILFQWFEYLFALFAAGIIPAELDPDMTELPPKRLKNASKNFLKELRTKLDIDPAYDARLSKFIDDRHTVIHGGPTRCGGLKEYLEFTNKCTEEAALHIAILLDLYRQWLITYYGNTDPLPPELVGVVELIGKQFPGSFKWPKGTEDKAK